MAQRTVSLLLFGSKNAAGRGGGSASLRLSKIAFAIGPTRSIIMLPSANSIGLSSSRTFSLSSQRLHNGNKALSSWAAAAADSSSMADPLDHAKLRAPDPHHHQHVNGGGVGEQHNHHMDLPAHEFAMGCHFLHQVALGMPIDALASILHDRPSLVNFRDYDRRSPLHVAASEGHLAICEFLVANGAVINRSDRWGGSPLDDAHRHRHAHVTKFLLAHGAVSGSPSQSNCFITAASEGDIDEVKAFLELGRAIVDVDKGDYDKRTALHLAAAGGHAEVVRLLCETAGANVNVKDRWGHRPLDDAKRSGQAECADILEGYGAKHGQVAAATTLLGKEALYDLMHKHGKIRDGNGELSMDWHDVKALLKDVGEDPSDEVVQKLFTVADVNGTGVIDTEEFITHSELFLGGRPARIILIVGGPGTRPNRCDRSGLWCDGGLTPKA
jgi:ankyrin repeat protein